MAPDLPFLLRQQAKDRLAEFEARQENENTENAENTADSEEETTAEDEDRLEPGPGQMEHEYQRLRHAAELAEAAHRRAEEDGGPG